MKYILTIIAILSLSSCIIYDVPNTNYNRESRVELHYYRAYPQYFYYPRPYYIAPRNNSNVEKHVERPQRNRH